MIVGASKDTEACYGVNKCAEIDFKNGKMMKGEGLVVLEERMKELDPEQNEMYKFFGYEQGVKIDVKRFMERVKNEIGKRLYRTAWLTGSFAPDNCLLVKTLPKF